MVLAPSGGFSEFFARQYQAGMIAVAHHEDFDTRLAGSGRPQRLIAGAGRQHRQPDQRHDRDRDPDADKAQQPHGRP